ncbi:RNA-directed DNA polymerase, eukaryota [Artemisia annua]|uniref:RNA-directed DNA polymerase, eukaryota n=1 Tax=Artemisia annua TaxID=35608 RepID=A0A2U1MBX6_ARTAN|nr:RNA-directed DNA polymerase, eukaryota [Artemisia annua]
MPRGGAEGSQFTALLEAIREVSLSDASDGWIWGLDHSGFSVASARKYIDEQVLTGGYTTTRWPRCVPIKVNVLMWRLGLNKLPTLVNMGRKGIDVASLLCPICRRMPRGGAEDSQFTALLEAIREVRLSDASDGWIWGLDHSGFSVASARKYIDEQVLTGGYTTTRWLRCVPIKANVFMWRLEIAVMSHYGMTFALANIGYETNFPGCSIWSRIKNVPLLSVGYRTSGLGRGIKDRLPTRMNLADKDIDIPSVLGPTCNNEFESLDHVFFKCDTTVQL